MTEVFTSNSGTLRRLSQWLAEPCDWPLRDRLALVQRLARLVQALHQSGRTHRAIDIDAVTVDEQLRPQLSSPAALRHFGGGDSDPEFCPPELTGGEGVSLPEEIDSAAKALQAAGYAVDPRRIDVYQLGVVLCRLVTGEPILSYIYDATIKGRVPALARPLLERTLGFDSPERFADCDRLIQSLDEALHKTELSETPTSAHETPALGSVILPDGNTPPFGTQRASESQSPSGLPFERLGHFRILEQIGRGGMGDVYRGFDESLDRPVAIKVLPVELARDESFVRRFQAEATAVAKVTHPNVVPIHFIGQDAGHQFFAMQFIDGESLGQRLAREQRLPVEQAVGIVEQCLAGLEAAHSRGLVHRDIKPGNVLLERGSGRAMLVDFGLVRRMGEAASMTATGVIMGTVDYIAPEQARGHKVDARTDIYSLGVLFYQLLSGCLPFLAESPTAMIFQHAYEPPFPLKEAAPDVPLPVVAIVARMMAKDPENRYPDCAAVLADLQAFRQGNPLSPFRREADNKNLPSPFGSESNDLPSPFGRENNSLPSPFGRGAGGEGSEADDLSFAADASLLPSDDPWHRMRDWAATMFRRYAPEQIQELQGTTQQMDAAVAHYQRRRDRLAKLLEEARGLDTEVTPEQVEDLQRQLGKADATLAQLRSQQDVLKARLQAAEARRQLDGGLPRPKRRRWLVVAAVAAALCVAVILLLSIVQPTRVVKKAPSKPVLTSTFFPVDLEGTWDAVLPAGATRQWRILNVGQGRYRIATAGVFSGIYQLRGDVSDMKLAVVEPDDKRLTEFAWLVKDPNHLVLIESPPVAKTGSDYRGATLSRMLPVAEAAVTKPVDPSGTVSSEKQTFIVANSPYWQTLTDMTQRKGMTVPKSFNYNYNEWLPLAKGHLLLVETHDGVPIVSLSVLEEFYPNASEGLKTPEGLVSIGNTKIIFVDLSRLLKGVPIDSSGVGSSDRQVFIVGNTPYWQTLTDMVQRKGLTVAKSFNTQYDELLPLAKGHVLLVETHDGIPIVPLSVLDKFYPGASEGLKTPERVVSIGNTKIVFVDFSRPPNSP